MNGKHVLLIIVTVARGERGCAVVGRHLHVITGVESMQHMGIVLMRTLHFPC